MDLTVQKRPLPSISVSKASSPVDDSFYTKSPLNEPEMEDVHDTSLLKNLIEELGLQPSVYESVDPLKHNQALGKSCLHCIISNKVQSLQTDISKMNHEIESTGEILHLKKEQNGELKEMIQRLEGNFGTEPKSSEIDKKGVNCSCMHKCVSF